MAECKWECDVCAEDATAAQCAHWCLLFLDMAPPRPVLVMPTRQSRRAAIRIAKSRAAAMGIEVDWPKGEGNE